LVVGGADAPMRKDQAMANILDTRLTTLAGEPTTFRELANDAAALVVNVASKCGYTSQYEYLEALHRELSPRGFTVIGVPCNQFGAEEPRTSAEIQRFCSSRYGVSFPMTEKVKVNGKGRSPLYAALVDARDESGYAGKVRWNFEKFLVAPDGRVVGRFDSKTPPDSPRIRDAIEAVLLG
jgi:glutathione peroxidase